MMLETAQNRKSADYSTEQIKTVCKSLKNRKARDESGFTYELFKPSNAGADFYQSLTLMSQKIKSGLIIHDFLQLMSITSIYKNKGLKCELMNERGVFGVSKIRSILDRVTYSEVYPIVDSELSYSNVGGRRKEKHQGSFVCCVCNYK